MEEKIIDPISGKKLRNANKLNYKTINAIELDQFMNPEGWC